MSNDTYSRPASFVPSWVVWGSLGASVGLFSTSGIIAFTRMTPLETSVGIAFALVGAAALLLPSTVGAVRWTMTYGLSGVVSTITGGDVGRTRVFVYPFLFLAVLVAVGTVVGSLHLSVPVLVALLGTVPLMVAGVARFQAWREQLEPDEEPLDRL